MPITPLHFGVLSPINYFAKGKVSNISFGIVTLWVDANSIIYALFGIGGYDHGSSHNVLGVLGVALIVSSMRFTPKWFCGCILAAITHLLLDGLVHIDMEPLAPFISGNFMFIPNSMPAISLVLLPFTFWFILQSVSNIMEKAHKFLKGS